VVAHEVLATVDQQFVSNQIAILQETLGQLQESLNTSESKKQSKSVKASVSGRVKNIIVSPGDDLLSASDTAQAALLISTKREMFFWVETEALMQDEEVDVLIEGVETTGTVTEVTATRSKVCVSTDEYPVGVVATVLQPEGGGMQGSLCLAAFVPVICDNGVVKAISVSENQYVSVLETLFTLNAYQDDTARLLVQVEQLRGQLSYYQQLTSNRELVSPIAGVIQEVPKSNEEYPSGNAIFVIIPTSDCIVNLSVPEYDVNKVRVGQDVSLTLNSSSHSIVAGAVISVSAIGSKGAEGKDAWAHFNVLVKIESQEEALVGSRVFGRIFIERHTDILVVPLKAIHLTEDGIQYVLIDTDDLNSLTNTLGEGYPPNASVIKTGIANGEYAEVVMGLTEGMKVLL
jgi:multidrug efflux pump subunit AcrA (membrane-fusion protein)